MNRALLYLATRSFINRVRFMASRMREPRYLVPFLVFALYLAFSTSGFLLPRGVRTADTSDYGAIAPLALEIGLFFFTCVTWLGGITAGAPNFTESEATLLLQAPFTRRRLVAFNLVRGQPQIALVSLFVAAMAAQGAPFYFAAPAAFLLLNYLVWVRMTAVMLAARLSGVRLGAWLARVPAIVLGALGVANAVTVYQPLDELPKNVAYFAAWLYDTLHTGPLNFVMRPFAAMAGLPVASDGAEFALRAGFVLALIGAMSGLIWLLDCPWEELAIARARKLGRWMESFRQGRALAVAPATERAKRSPFALAPQGPHWRAFAWKSLTSLMRQISSRALVLILSLLMPALALGVSMIGGTERNAWLAPLAIIGMIQLMLPMMGPALFPHDIRGELQRIDLLKSFPVPGRDIMRGGVWACTGYVGFYQFILLVAGVLLVNGPVHRPFPVADRVLFAAGVAPVLPMLTALSFTLEGAGAVLMPSWLMSRAQAGVEAAGRNMLMAFIRLVGASLCLVPVAALVVPLGVLLWPVAGVRAMPLLGLAAGALLWLEVELMIRWAGGRLATLDPAMEQVG